MAYLVDEIKQPTAFVEEEIPQSFKDSFDPGLLYTPLGGRRWPDDRWVIDHARNVALIGGGTNSKAASDEGVTVTIWDTLLVQGKPVGLLYSRRLELLEGKDPRTGREYELQRLFNAHLYLPAELYGRKDEIVALAEEANYVFSRGPVRAWVRGVVIELAEAHLDTEYRSSRHAV
ncbi:hypothetical protein [Hydrogenophaga electricum]|uniref:Uncharacterized protein n=1 Tax=Hydrogenophaga electricum TaxID=1230953 RepID=A0ABQ6CCH3_9BURK|nr:hypothetical protein [Hydrogenophaga electricum]GLS15912.1 hypothetical protein GCM10007935_33490 [Hydrogenophaga electricum]